MTDKKHEASCPMCALTKRIFGNKIRGCGDIANKPAEEAHDLIVARMTQYNKEARAQFERGKITVDQYHQFVKLLSDSYPYAATMIPAMALMNGARIDPPTLINQARDQIVRAVAIMIEANGLEPLLESLMGGAAEQGKEKDETEERAEPVSLSQLN